MNRVPNPNQAHASISTTGSAQTLAQLGYVFNANTDNLLIQAVGGDVRMTLNGTAPTASLGIKIVDGATIELDRNEANVARFITGASAPKLEIVAYIK